MRKIFRSFLIEAGVLYLISQATTGLSFQGGVQGIFIAGMAITLASFLIKPIINILLLPINLLTFGVFKWLASAVTLYLVDLILEGFKVGLFAFAGFSHELVSLPAFSTESIFFSYIIFSLILNFLSSILYWFTK